MGDVDGGEEGEEEVLGEPAGAEDEEVGFFGGCHEELELEGGCRVCEAEKEVQRYEKEV